MAEVQKGFVESLSVDTAEEFMDKLAPSRAFWGEDPQDWLFRGHGDSLYRLIPGAMRSDRPPAEKPVEMLIDGRWVRGPLRTAREQRQGEFELVQRFFRLADAQGLPIPDDGPALRALTERASPPDGAWPPEKMHGLIALAQHYGIPTRVLDWSRRPLVAAYFAASGAAKAVHDGRAAANRRLTVWALRRRIGNRRGVPQDFGIELISAPRSGNPNLHLQSGLFTLRSDDGTRQDEAPDLRTIDEVVNSTAAPAWEAPFLREITLPATEAAKLMRILRDHFVQAATIYAGYEGVRQSVFEMKYRA
jgi:hypothetical protein